MDGIKSRPRNHEKGVLAAPFVFYRSLTPPTAISLIDLQAK